MSIDTTSHLYRVLFLHQWLDQGVFPFWSPDWYAGSPSILLYPPLGYYLAIGVSATGVDPVLSYKLVDALFYWLAPLTVFFLGRELGFSKGESALGSLFFSVVPAVIENYLFFDRYPTVISIPFFCAFIIMFHRALSGQRIFIGMLGSIFTMSGLLLTHHLSALIAGVVAILMVALTAGKAGLTKPLTTLLIVAIGTLGLTSFWLVPFLGSFRLFSANGFYNRNVTFPFLRFLYFGFDVTSYLLGIAQFVLAAVATQSILSRVMTRRIPVHATAFFPILVLGMVLFQAGELLPGTYSVLTVVGRAVVIASFTLFLGQFLVLPAARQVISKQNGVFLTVVWFVIFLWIGLGYYSLPVLWLPYISEFWIKTMDVYRVWLYLALPMSLMAAVGFLRCATRIWRKKPVYTLVLLALIITPTASGVALKANYAFNNQVNGVLPYTAANAEIPQPVINYFRNDSSQGRILGIDVPLWIYLLPNYVGKPLVDGWYPQSKLVTPLLEINDYRLDDLETHTTDGRLETWKSLIANSTLLDVTWLMIGNVSIANDLKASITAANFTERAAIPYQSGELMIFKTGNVPAFVEAKGTYVQTVSRPTPDKIIVTLSPSSNPATILVKEAYFPTWAAETDRGSLVVQRESGTGFIQVTVPPDTSQLIIYQTPQSNVWNMVSAISLAICVVFGTIVILRERRSSR